jgi:hypothetical protein
MKISQLQFNTLTNALARCPHCRKVSSVGVEFAKNRSNVYLALGILFLALAIAMLWVTYSYAGVSVESRLIAASYFTLHNILFIFFLHYIATRRNMGCLFCHVFSRFSTIRPNLLLSSNESECHRRTDLREHNVRMCRKLLSLSNHIRLHV